MSSRVYRTISLPVASKSLCVTGREGVEESGGEEEGGGRWVGGIGKCERAHAHGREGERGREGEEEKEGGSWPFLK